MAEGLTSARPASVQADDFPWFDARLAPSPSVRHLRLGQRAALFCERAQQLFSHADWSRDVLEMTKRAYRLFIAEGEKRLRGKGARPRSGRAKPTRDFSRHATSEIYERHGEQCAFVDERTGLRCNSRAFLQIDHVILRAFGGTSEPDNGRPLCARHNAFEAKRVLGRDYVESRIRDRQQQRQRAKCVSSATRVGASASSEDGEGDDNRESPG